MGLDVLEIFASSLLSALVSSFLAAYLTYRYTELSWRKRRHFEDIKEVCLKEILGDVNRFEEHFTFVENQISGLVGSGTCFSTYPSSVWCVLFSFGFEDPPTDHYHLLLQDLKNHFPKLVNKLKMFEVKMRELCPRFNEILCRVVEQMFNEAKRITSDDVLRRVAVEVIVMTLAGYDEWRYPNNKRFLEEKNLYEDTKKLVSEAFKKHQDLITNFINIRNEALNTIKETKEEVVRLLNTHKLPGKCELL